MPGRASQGFSGDGGPATAAKLNYPVALAFDGAGNLYIADARNNRIRKVDTLGTISTVAGSGGSGHRNGGFSGDGGPATAAQLSSPLGVAVDQGDNVYIADYSNHRVRKVDPSGTITTVAGSGGTLPGMRPSPAMGGRPPRPGLLTLTMSPWTVVASTSPTPTTSGYAR